MKPRITLREGAELRDLWPFRFEDLAGELEPDKWGPIYDLKLNKRKPIGEQIRAINAIKNRPSHLKSNCASGQANEFSAKKHRAKLLAELHARAAIDRRNWAVSEGIESAYASCPKMGDRWLKIAAE